MKLVFAVSGAISAILWVICGPSWLAYVTVFLAVWISFIKLNEPYDLFRKNGFVGPEPTFLLGNLPALGKKGFFNFEKETYLQYKSEGRKFFVTFFGRQPVIHVTDLDLVKQITIKEAATFTDRLVLDFSASPFDLNLLAIEGDHWKHVRSQITPTFSSGRLKNMVPLIQMAVDKIVDNVEQSVDKNEEVEVKTMTGGYTLDVIASTLFGLDIDSQKNPDDIFVKNAKKIFESFGFKNLIFMMAIVFPKFICYFKNIDFINQGKPIIDFFRKVVEECLTERKGGDQGDDQKHRDFLQLMIDSEVGTDEVDRVTHTSRRDYHWSSKGLTREEILAQAIVFFLAGYETTANTLVWLIYLLCMYPDVQDKVSEEIQEHLGDELPNYENLSKLTYLDMCVNETLRLYPQAPRIDRVPNKDIEIGGVLIQKGQPVAISVVGFHYDPELWDEPEQFRPERFTPEAKASRHPVMHMPFGAGPRNCVGMRLALMELKMAFVEIMQKYKIIPSESTQRPEDIKMSKVGIAVPETPIKLKFTPRF